MLIYHLLKYLDDSVQVSINPDSRSGHDQFSVVDRQRYAELKSEPKKQEFLCRAASSWHWS